MMAEKRGWTPSSGKTTAPILSVPGKLPGKQYRQDAIRWPCAPRMKRAPPSLMSRSGIPEAICGTASNGRNWWWAMPAEGRTAMKNRTVAIFVAACGLALAAGVVYADLKKGYYSPDQLGSIQQAAPAAL